ncbi:helix-turn-helix domain-containing protein [Runella salmonicolor]|uniref:AraC family transcriptional regulator n=1 Tax=Runella salmonicolor TaxID=2950278 RepID=A0ABT1FT70_9BACT|nr:AraC family transcriptional regulator [Runella salmonicolor]MCP1384695.1 AraC family transcriptional regulator [Runella salmonicolor]
MNDLSQNLTDDSLQMNIYLNVGYIDKVLPFLLSNQIAFTLSGTEAPPSWGKAHLSELSPIDGVYHKYIVEGVEKIPPKMEEIAAEIGLSIAQFKKLFKARFGKPFYRVYMEYKMEYAAGLLREGQTASSVSERVGYTQPIKFNKMFQKFYGTTPFKYRKSQA